jgi:hypothetical protein
MSLTKRSIDKWILEQVDIPSSLCRFMQIGSARESSRGDDIKDGFFKELGSCQSMRFGKKGPE